MLGILRQTVYDIVIFIISVSISISIYRYHAISPIFETYIRKIATYHGWLRKS